MLVLPVQKTKPKVNNPRYLIIFGKPKSGKTTLLSKLDGCLIIDLEGGSEFLEALSIQARNVNDLGNIANAIRDKIRETGNKPYKYNWCRNLGLILMLITLLDAILLRAYFIITMLPLLILNIIYITGTRNNAEIDSNRNL